MITELLRKWFGLEASHCEACEVLRSALSDSERERRELLHRLLDKPQVEPPSEKEEEPVPIQPQFTPWGVRRQLLEAEDRKQAQLMRDSAKNIAKLEKELDIAQDVSSASGGVQFK